jgi:predicted dehydrogenase
MKLGIIGLGRVAWLLDKDPLRPKPATHWGAWQLVKGVRLAAVCDRDPARLEAFLDEHPKVRGYTDYRQMLREEPLDLLSIAAYADTRQAMVSLACRSGVKGIWCEKAMGTSLEDALKIERAVKRHKVQLAMSYPRRWGAAYQWVAQALQQGDLGRLESINVQFPGNFIHTGTHAFDVLRMWCGEAVAVQGWLEGGSQHIQDSGYRFETQFDEARPQNDLGGFGLIWFENGARATLQAGAKNYFRFEFELLTDRAMVRLGNSQRELWQVASSPRFTGFQELQKVDFPSLQERNVFSAVAFNLAEAVSKAKKEQPSQGAGASKKAAFKPVLCDATDGRKALEIGLALHQSHAGGNTVVRMQELSQTLKVQNR